MQKKAYLQMSFAWLFAIIIGAFILFATIYAVNRVSDTGQQVQTTVTSKEIQTLLNPLETGFESSASSSISTSAETRIYNDCLEPSSGDIFGSQEIRIAQKSMDKWSAPSMENTFSNKYLFSDNIVQSKTFYLFSKPLEFPFKVSDLIYITPSTEKYCFVGNVPEEIGEEITELQQPNLILENCTENNIKVCFSEGENCNIEVNYIHKKVEKGEDTLYFNTDSLMYAAIFSEKDIYECQLERLMSRIDSLAKLYKDKEGMISSTGCFREVSPDLTTLEGKIQTYSDSRNINSFNLIIENLERSNRGATCRLW
ncbi:hypothetical protein ISS08_00215 [Candidatus Pacearchaeota archaeon]|nr:hypothetical protein [Candidatus Pacearchaeota archaeon]